MKMTEIEAKEILKNITKHTRVRDDEIIYSSKYVKAYEMAIKALEKQIAKKMLFTPKKFPCDYECPNGCKQYDEYKINYCPNCGQKLDWE